MTAQTELICAAGEAALPQAIVDGKYVRQDSVMLCDWEQPQKRLIWTKTSMDYEMMLWAWKENKLQNYIGTIFGDESQGYYHSNR